MEYKICPILNINNTNTSDMRISAKNGLVYCLEKECAWWDEANDCCIVQALSRLGRRQMMDTYSFYEEELCMFLDCICYYSGRCAVCPKLAEYDAYGEAHPIELGGSK